MVTLNNNGLPVLLNGRIGKVLWYKNSTKIIISLGRNGAYDWFEVAKLQFIKSVSDIEKVEKNIKDSHDAELFAKKLNSNNFIFESNIPESKIFKSNDEIINGYKKCSCKTHKGANPIVASKDFFYSSKTRESKLQSWCIQCTKERGRLHRKKTLAQERCYVQEYKFSFLSRFIFLITADYKTLIIKRKK